MPATGSGERTSNITEADAEYCFGKIRLTASATPTASKNTANAKRHRASKIKKN